MVAKHRANPFVPSSVQRLITKATKPNYKTRFQNSAEMQVAIQRAKVVAPPWQRTDDYCAEATNWKGRDWRIVVDGDASWPAVLSKRSHGAPEFRRIHQKFTVASAMRFVEDA
jgi:hypothetical protein